MMEMISLKNLENAERCLMRAEAHKAWKGGEIYFFEISFHVVEKAIGKSFISKGNIRYIVSRDR